MSAPIAAVTVAWLPGGSDPLIVETGDVAKGQAPQYGSGAAIVRNEPRLKVNVLPAGYEPLDRVVEVSQAGHVLVGGKAGAAEVILSSGFSFNELEPITARIVLNRSMVYFTGDEAYAITSPDFPLEVAAVKVDRSKASSLIVYDGHWKRWVLKLPIDNQVPNQFHLQMPGLTFRAAAGANSGQIQIPVPYGPLSGSQTLQAAWTATLAWDAVRYNSQLAKLPKKCQGGILNASHSFSGTGNPWTVPFGDVYDGGEFVVTAEVEVPKRSGGGFYKVAALDSWKIFARAERQTKRTEVKAAAQLWINAQPPKKISDSEGMEEDYAASSWRGRVPGNAMEAVQ